MVEEMRLDSLFGMLHVQADVPGVVREAQEPVGAGDLEQGHEGLLVQAHQGQVRPASPTHNLPITRPPFGKRLTARFSPQVRLAPVRRVRPVRHVAWPTRAACA